MEQEMKEKELHFSDCSLKKMDVNLYKRHIVATFDNEVDWKREWESDVFFRVMSQN